jgi:hypothetical protein
MLATQSPADHFDLTRHQQHHDSGPVNKTSSSIETLVEADHPAPHLNEDDPFVKDILRDGVSHELVPEAASVCWLLLA